MKNSELNGKGQLRQLFERSSLLFETWFWVAAVLVIGCATTMTIAHRLQKDDARHAQTQFSHQADVAAGQLQAAIDKEKALVFALQGLFETFGDVSRAQFNRFVNEADVENMFPSTHALSWNERVSSPERDDFEQRVRLDDSVRSGGYPDFSIRPDTDSDEHYVVNYIEPMAGNESAFGFDIGSRPDRLQTVEQARDRDEALATAPISLMQKQKGFLLMLPVYRSAAPGERFDRRVHFRGLVVAVFRIEDLITGSMNLDFTGVSVHDITVDDALSQPASQAVSVFETGSPDAGEGAVTLRRSVEVGGRVWQLSFTQSAAALGASDVLGQRVVLILGGLVTLLAALLMGYLASSRQRSQRLAEQLTLNLKTANEELSRANQDLSQFAHVASHDLQTPVRNIMGSASMLEDAIGDEPDAEVRQCLGFIKDSALRMRTLIQNLLRYAESGQAMEKRKVDLNATLSLVSETTSDICQTRDAVLEIGPMPTVIGDGLQLERVFTNLVTNAIKYSREGTAPIVKLAANDAGEFHEIRISDNGIGIESDYQKQVFEPFKRLHSHGEIAGSGLGLAICNQIIDKHGGRIEIEQSSEQGTTIMLTLPAAA